jgi:hypothetical protein
MYVVIDALTCAWPSSGMTRASRMTSLWIATYPGACTICSPLNGCAAEMVLKAMRRS